jgi:hypothetical protein
VFSVSHKISLFTNQDPNNYIWQELCGLSPWLGVELNAGAGAVEEESQSNNWAWTQVKFQCNDFNGEYI